MINQEIKIKAMNADELTLAIDRLTRFKLPDEKYNRVFKEIIAKYQISPKIGFKEYEKLSEKEIGSIVENIFNYSINLLSSENNVTELYKSIFKSENKIFNISDATRTLMSAKIPYEAILKINKDKELCKNLKFWKYFLSDNINPKSIRSKFKTRFPVEKIVLAEGITEEILLPKFADLLGYNFDENGVELIAAGGKNQVAKDYLKYKEALKIPIVILLDSDAKSVADTISSKLRSCDRLILIEKGEFEDILPLSLITKAINYKFANFYNITENEFNNEVSRVKNLEEIYRINGLGEFKKAEFAHNIDTVLSSISSVSGEIMKIIEEIKLM